MRFLTLTLLVKLKLVNVMVKADWMKMNEEIKKIMGQNKTQDRNQASLWGAGNFAFFSRYGCWCNFNDDGSLQGSLGNRHGMGKPKDELDEACRSLQWGYDCILMEAEQNGYRKRDFYYIKITE